MDSQPKSHLSTKTPCNNIIKSIINNHYENNYSLFKLPSRASLLSIINNANVSFQSATVNSNNKKLNLQFFIINNLVIIRKCCHYYLIKLFQAHIPEYKYITQYHRKKRLVKRTPKKKIPKITIQTPTITISLAATPVEEPNNYFDYKQGLDITSLYNKTKENIPASLSTLLIPSSINMIKKKSVPNPTLTDSCFSQSIKNQSLDVIYKNLLTMQMNKKKSVYTFKKTTSSNAALASLLNAGIAS